MRVRGRRCGAKVVAFVNSKPAAAKVSPLWEASPLAESLAAKTVCQRWFSVLCALFLFPLRLLRHSRWPPGGKCGLAGRRRFWLKRIVSFPC